MYQALYRKWRPKLFDDVVGQSHITETLKNQVRNNRLSHAYLFTGTRGTGKTTCAKILAKAVNCQHPVEGNPCGTCPACVGIDSGSILDVVELDAASNNGVDQVRALRDEAIYAPAAVRKRVYIVDEVHMLSVAAFNALLKILEEPPEHLIFILATTELHKVPATILSRCQRFSFKRILPAEIQNRLLTVAERENIDLTQDGAALLARLADGALRDALSLLDQCAVSGRQVNRELVLETLGLAGNLKTAHIMNAIRKGDTEGALTQLAQLYEAGKDVSAVLSELSALTRDLLIRKTAANGGEGLLTGGYDEETLRTLSKGLTAERLLQMLQLLQSAQAGLKTSANRRTDAELCLIQLCDPRLDGSVEALAARVAQLEAKLAAGIPVAAPSVEEALPELPPEPVRETVVPQPEPPVEEDLPPWDLEPPPEELPPVEPEPVRQAPIQPEPVPKQGAPAPRPGVSGGDSQFWTQLVSQLRPVVGPAAYPFLANPSMTSGRLEGDLLTLYVSDAFVKGMVDKPPLLQKVSEAAAGRYGGPVQVKVTVGAPPAEPIQEAGVPNAEEADPFADLVAFGRQAGMTID